MKKILTALLAVSAVATPALAQRYDDRPQRGYERNYNRGAFQSINQRQDNLYRRIEQGVRNGSLTRGEAQRLRSRFVALDRLEQRYRRDGLSQYERRDLNQRFDALSRQVRSERRDGQDRRYR